MLRATLISKKHTKPVWLFTITGLVILLFSSWGKSDRTSYRYKAGYLAYQLAVTTHQLHIGGQQLSYTATTGYMPLTGADGQTSANIFYVAYQTDSLHSADRPITFVFNGGPGSAAIWLHMGSFGPVRVLFKNDKGDAPDASYQYGDNPYSWLGFTDLVFIDPVSTGYSRPEDEVNVKQFYGYDGDIASIGQFIHLYLTQHHRENSPKFLAGESYGTVRAVGLAAYLQDQYQIAFNGITLISPALNYQLIDFHHGNETPYSYYLPSYAVAAQYHQRLNNELQRLSPQQLIAKASSFAQGTYTFFLNQGEAASAELTNKVIDSLHYFTSLPLNYIRQINGRITDRQFCQALLKKDGLTIGGFDSRFTGDNKLKADPSETNISRLFTSAFAQYVNNDLKYLNKLPYMATTATGDWNYGPDASNSYLNISETLKNVMAKNPGLKVNVVCGLYDLATPVGSTEYVIRHLGLKPELRNNISMHYYDSGHMVYISNTADAQFSKDGERFYEQTLSIIN
ncbi:hypothetical protein KXQ82_02195 [Mucilaginibacter sp. HMF5004]|uniref:S10 family peptidase n=1 Tax=Mucilaginibacter rivuli TaxID=2857527 RepID=UPI001C5F4E2E|nr:hypothetical protein [Mucilaginibacter rivuli]MBW4888501.1 hypothetical protein [Mucilaginibacter rivuli]